MNTTDRRPATAGRARVEAAALRLFAEEGIDATSLQRIADALGVTKAAVYWHYRSKDEIVLGVLRPALARLETIVADAESRHGRRARVETALAGLVDLTVGNRQLSMLLLSNVTVHRVLARHPPLQAPVRRLADILSDGEGGEARVAATLFLAGMAGPATDPGCAGLDDEALRGYLVAAGRRLLLGRRRPAEFPAC